MITELIESDDLKGLKGFNLSIKDIQDLRFEFNRNYELVNRKTC